MAFILGSKYKPLREAAKNGDERAKSILKMQFDGSEQSELDASVEEYFNPPQKKAPPIQEAFVKVEEPVATTSTGNKALDKFLRDNSVSEDSEDYEDYVNTFYDMFPKNRPIKPTRPTEPIVDMGDSQPVESEIVDGKEHLFVLEEAIHFLIKDENEALDGYDKVIKDIVNNKDVLKLDDIKLQGLVSKLQEIKNEEIQHIKELQEMIK